MVLTEKYIKDIEKGILILDPDKELEIETAELKVGDKEIMLFFPRDEIRISVTEFLKYLPEFDSIHCSDTKVTSNKFTQVPVYSFGKPIDYIANEINFVVEESLYKLRLVNNPILIGIAATKLGLYDKYAPPCSSYVALEIEYKSQNSRLTDDEELKIIKAFLYEMSYVSKSSIDFNVIQESGFFDDYEKPQKQDITLSSLTVYSEGMDLFRKAINSTDKEISFLYFYKIIEYYSPIAARKLAFENLLKKIDTFRYRTATSNDLASIFSIADKFRVSLTDKELAQTLLVDSIDIVDLFSKLPSEIKLKMTKNLHFQESDLNYKSKNEILQGIIKSLGNILYSTRNSIVHAKSNYNSDNNECSSEGLPGLNEFLKEACYSIISWNNRLPNHLKFE
ncbi:hypothetical protein NG800_019070 [Epilithonimonas ginsengisoli]|uniref:Apea-like HEPN domain-containing protein n=1 Tax=Epilithonimonas ginsengisoli TaxID=1245592 RepID=A0ABU4JN04_9FLAO|nr:MULTISPECIES: methylamine utilization protein MauJ [Chryseobacterium group]MBV6881539.1 hypothetical protein [Epilithonimonas sp. FP105]MDW8551027.1 hypothetical protein [Epilithonimonas ginsengisoli]OAH70793.1 hypothetical protein AXA65_12430 [Chryseobacterium sp. FP211-J200]